MASEMFACACDMAPSHHRKHARASPLIDVHRRAVRVLVVEADGGAAHAEDALLVLASVAACDMKLLAQRKARQKALEKRRSRLGKKKAKKKKMSKLIVDFQLTSYLHFDALAMGNTTGTVHMYLPKEKGRVDEGGQIETSGVESQWKDRGGVKVEGIEMTTIDRYLAGKKLLGKEIAFLKIDVEKLDFLVIQGASNVFKNQLVQLGQYEYIDGAISLVEITEWLKERGYTSYVMWSPRNVLRLDGLSREGIERVSGKLAQVNVLFARMKDRCVSRALASYAGKPNLFPFKCFRGTIEHSPLLK